jgi:hypothetical protein
MRYIKCFYKTITSNKTGKDYYIYSQAPSFQCNVKLGKSTKSLPVSFGNASNEDSLTLWLGNSDEMSPAEAEQFRKTFGDVAYFAIDADNNFELVSELPQGASVVTSLFA